MTLAERIQHLASVAAYLAVIVAMTVATVYVGVFL